MALEGLPPLPIESFVQIDHEANTITFKLQKGPIKEFGENGCQVDEMIRYARYIIGGLNQTFPCRENSCTLTKLDEALMWLEARTKDRTARAVEGTNQT